MSEVWRDRDLRIVFSVTLMAVLGVSVVTPAFPGVVEALGIDRSEVGLLVTAFTLPGILVTPLLGVAADRIGRRTVLVPSLLLFGVAGGMCVFARDMETLLALRALQGVGAGALGVMNVTLIGDLFSGGDCVAAMGYNSAVLSVGTASYPFIGGLLAEFQWYYPFGVPFMAVPVALLVLLRLRAPEPSFHRELSEYVREALRSLGSREVAVLLLASVTSFIMVFGAVLTFVPILMEERFGSSSTAIGLSLSLMSALTAVVSTQLVSMGRRLTERSMLLAAFLLYGLSLAAIPLAREAWQVAVPLLGIGVAQGINYPTIQTLLSRKAPAEYRAAFMSSNGAALRLGQTLGPLLMGAALASWGTDAPFLLGAAIAVCTLPVILLLFNGVERICEVRQ